MKGNEAIGKDVIGKDDLVITRKFDAPRDLIWKAWTEPERMKKWWGPKDFTAPFAKIDPRIGGRYHLCMRAPDGKEYWSAGTYKEMVEGRKLIASDSFADELGNMVPASYYGIPNDYPMEMLVTVTLEDDQGGTKMTLRHSGMPPGQNSDMAKMGWNESFDKLSENLKEQDKVLRKMAINP